MPRYNNPRKTWRYSVEFKVKAVQLSMLESVQVMDVARTLDIHPFMLSRWRKEYREGIIVADKRRKVTLEVNRSDQVWVSDITYIKVKDVYKYLIAIMDVYSRRIISGSLTETRTVNDTLTVLKRAVSDRQPNAGLIFHTDRGIEYTGHEFRRILAQHGIRASVNRLGICTDNGHMESFFHSLKAELIRGRKFNSMSELRYSLNSYINHFYNKKRLHSGIGYYSPIEYEKLAA